MAVPEPGIGPGGRREGTGEVSCRASRKSGCTTREARALAATADAHSSKVGVAGVGFSYNNRHHGARFDVGARGTLALQSERSCRTETVHAACHVLTGRWGII